MLVPLLETVLCFWDVTGNFPLPHNTGMEAESMDGSLCSVVVVVGGQAVLVTYLPPPCSKVVVTDSRGHGDHGAIIAVADRRQSLELGFWMMTTLFDGHKEGFELHW